MSPLVSWKIPAPFIVSRVALTPGEIGFGYRLGWLMPRDLIELVRQSNAGDVVGRALPATNADDSRSVDEVASALEGARSTAGDEALVWTYLGLAWLLDQKESIPDPFEVLERLFEDFDHSMEFEGLVRWMPPPPGQRVGLDAMEERWRQQVETLGGMFRERRRAIG